MNPPPPFSPLRSSHVFTSPLSHSSLISQGVRRTKKGTPTGSSHQGKRRRLSGHFPVVTPSLPSFVLTAVRLCHVYNLHPPICLVKQLFLSPLILFLFSIVYFFLYLLRVLYILCFIFVFLNILMCAIFLLKQKRACIFLSVCKLRGSSRFCCASKMTIKILHLHIYV